MLSFSLFIFIWNGTAQKELNGNRNYVRILTWNVNVSCTHAFTNETCCRKARLPENCMNWWVQRFLRGRAVWIYSLDVVIKFPNRCSFKRKLKIEARCTELVKLKRVMIIARVIEFFFRVIHGGTLKHIRYASKNGFSWLMEQI